MNCIKNFLWPQHYDTATATAAKWLQLCLTLCKPIDTAHQAPPSLGFSRQEHWSGLPFPSPIHESAKWKWNHSVVSDSLRHHGLYPTRSHILGIFKARALWYEISIIGKKKTLKNTNTWWLNTTFLNNEQFTEEIREITTFLETKNNENMMIRNLEDATKAVLRGKFIEIQILPQETHWIDDLTLRIFNSF